MSDIFQIANIGLIDSKQRLESISMNAASASLTGYRRHVVAGRTFDAALAATAESGTLTTAAANRPALQQVDLQPGAMIATSRPLDVAIETDGAFFALTDGTQTWLTRAGDFQLNEEGVLVGERGLRVVGAQGDSVCRAAATCRLPPTDASRTRAWRGSAATVQAHRSGFVAGGGGLAAAGPPGTEPVAANAVRIRSGTLEASNTDAGREMLGRHDFIAPIRKSESGCAEL